MWEPLRMFPKSEVARRCYIKLVKGIDLEAHDEGRDTDICSACLKLFDYHSFSVCGCRVEIGASSSQEKMNCTGASSSRESHSYNIYRMVDAGHQPSKGLSRDD